MKTNKSTSPLSSSGGFTLIEMLVVIAIIGLLSSLVLGPITRSLGRAKEIQKMSNLRSMHQANLMYAFDNDGVICPVENSVDYDGNGRNWRDLLSSYLADDSDSRGDGNKHRIFIDPFYKYDEDNAFLTGYGLNRNPGLPEITQPNALKGESYDRSFSVEGITYPSSRIMIGDTGNQWFISKNKYETQIDTTRHRGKGMFLFFDGSVKKLDQEQAELAFSDPAKTDF